MLVIFMIMNVGLAVPISRADLTSITWQFGRGDGSVISNNMHLVPDGTISGYSNPNERRWCIKGDELVFYNENGQAATRFNQFRKENGYWVIRGPFILPTTFNPYHVLKQLDIPKHRAPAASQFEMSIKSNIPGAEVIVGIKVDDKGNTIPCTGRYVGLTGVTPYTVPIYLSDVTQFPDNRKSIISEAIKDGYYTSRSTTGFSVDTTQPFYVSFYLQPNVDCGGLKAEIESLEAELEVAQADLYEASPMQKPHYAGRIKTLSAQKDEIEKKYRKSCPS